MRYPHNALISNTLQKATFYVAKGCLLHGEMLPFASQKVTFGKTADRNHDVYLNQPAPQLNVWVKPIDANGADRLSDLAVIV